MAYELKYHKATRCHPEDLEHYLTLIQSNFSNKGWSIVHFEKNPTNFGTSYDIEIIFQRLKQ